MLTQTLDNKERVIKAKVELNKSHAFFAYILLHMAVEKTEATEEIPTMAVNQYGDLYWNEEFVGKLSNDNLRAVLCHEVMHVSTLTMQRKGMRDMGLWNIATDLVINYILKQEGFTLPQDVLLPDHRGQYTFPSGKNGKTVRIDMNGKCAEQVYDEISKNAKVVKKALNVQGDGQYEGQVGKHIEGDADDKGNSQGKDKGDGKGTASNEQKWRRKATEAATNAKMRGNMSAEMERMLGGVLEPVVDWRQKLFAYITNEIPVDYTMRMPSRRMLATGVYTPQVVRESLDVICGVDISGSIGDEEYKEFMGEVIGIADSYTQVNLRVIGWAHNVDKRDDVLVSSNTKERLLANKFYGGGGTSLSCFTEHCKKNEYHSRIYVILTDGYIEHDPILPDDGECLFVLSRNSSGEVVKKFGDVTSLNDTRR